MSVSDGIEDGVVASPCDGDDTGTGDGDLGGCKGESDGDDGRNTDGEDEGCGDIEPKGDGWTGFHGDIEVGDGDMEINGAGTADPCFSTGRRITISCTCGSDIDMDSSMPLSTVFISSEMTCEIKFKVIDSDSLNALLLS
jgi:hypothetical protein